MCGIYSRVEDLDIPCTSKDGAKSEYTNRRFAFSVDGLGNDKAEPQDHRWTVQTKLYAIPMIILCVFLLDKRLRGKQKALNDCQSGECHTSDQL